MKKEVKYLGLGLIFTLGAFGSSEINSRWLGSVAVGIAFMIYGTHLMITNYKKKEAFKYVIPGWIIFVAIGFLTLPGSLSASVIRESDLGPATNFENISTCEEGRSRADEDIKAGKLRFLFGSYGGRSTLAKNLEENYDDIEVIILDGVLGEPNECYNQVMFFEIQNKYGKDIFYKESIR